MYGHTYFHEFQMLASEGYAIVYINPHGSHGYGQMFTDRVRGSYGDVDYDDVMQAVDHVLKAYDFLDETRLGVTGGSYGGFMTNWIVGQTDRFRAAVTQRSISNWISFTVSVILVISLQGGRLMGIFMIPSISYGIVRR